MQLEYEPKFEVKTSVSSSKLRTMELVLHEHPDVAVIDISMPGTSVPELLSTFKQEKITTQVPVLTSNQDAQMVEQMLGAGAGGYVLKDNAFNEILVALQSVAAGHTYVSAQLAGRILRSELKLPNVDVSWTMRQLTILRMVSDGKTTRQIALELGIHTKTVDNHRHRIRQKLGAKSSPEMISEAKNRGLI